jgi:beta-galactosidase
VIMKHLPAGTIVPDVPAAKPVMHLPAIKFTVATSLFDVPPVKDMYNKTPLTFEDLNQAYGFVVYTKYLTDVASGILKIKGLRDYAIVFINGKRVAILDRRLKQDSAFIEIPKGKITLDILVENLGRINFGPYLLKNKKGITGEVMLDDKEITGWLSISLPFNNINTVKPIINHTKGSVPVIKSATVNIENVADTYFDMSNWGKGVVWVNGHNLGRYWSIGPQQTIYVPAEWLKKGKNKIDILELIKPEQSVLQSVEKPILDKLNK